VGSPFILLCVCFMKEGKEGKKKGKGEGNRRLLPLISSVRLKKEGKRRKEAEISHPPPEREKKKKGGEKFKLLSLCVFYYLSQEREKKCLSLPPSASTAIPGREEKREDGEQRTVASPALHARPSTVWRKGGKKKGE